MSITNYNINYRFKNMKIEGMNVLKDGQLYFKKI